MVLYIVFGFGVYGRLVMDDLELPWEKAQREYNEMSPEEQTWHKISEPACSKVYYIDVSKMSWKQASNYLERVKEALKNGR